MKMLTVERQSEALASIDPHQMISAVRRAIVAPSDPSVSNPPKIFLGNQNHGFAIAMLAASEQSGLVGMKCYAEGPPDGPRMEVTNVIYLFERGSFRPLGVLDCERITSLRTAATSWLFVEQVSPKASRVMVIGGGRQGRMLCELLLDVMPEGKIVLATRQKGLAERIRAEKPEGRATLREVDDFEIDVYSSDVVIAAAGPGTLYKVNRHLVQPGALVIALGHGVDPDVLHFADRVLTTSRGQMKETGQDLATDGMLREADAELWRFWRIERPRAFPSVTRSLPTTVAWQRPIFRSRASCWMPKPAWGPNDEPPCPLAHPTPSAP